MAQKNLAALLVSIVGILAAPASSARDDLNKYPISEAMSAPDATAKLNRGIKFFFGGSAHPAVAKSFGVFTSNKKTNGFGKVDKDACNWAFLSATLSFQDRALAEGGDAVINIESYYKKQLLVSETEFECGSGALMSGVTFRGEVVKLQ